MKIIEAPLTTLPLTPPRSLPESAVPVTRSRLADYVMLAKPRLTLMVLFTVAAGFVLASRGAVNGVLLLNTLLGTALVAAGASALNQLLERGTDARMERTRQRPLPAGRLKPREVLRFGALTACAGFVYLTVAVNPLTGLLAVVTLASYVFAYTPLKRKTTLNTLVGAVPGALPPVMGWAAASGAIGLEAGTLFLILFLWQFPHFWAIAWLYRNDYARAGLRMVPVLDRDGGHMTGRLMVHHCLVLIPASLGPVLLHMAGPRYFLGAVALGAMFLAFALRFLFQPSDRRARHMLWASLVYLPALLTLLIADGGWFLVFPEG
jgi:protoheme IX farnesyltransferase